MAVVTIRGRLGSGAEEIGRLIADRLHADYVDRETIAEAAVRLRWPEKGIAEKEKPPGSFMERIVMGRIAAVFGRIGIYESAYLPTW